MSGGEIYGKYQLLAQVATGGMAEVFLARSSSIGGFEKILAIKRMHPRLGAHAGFVSLFIEEAKLSVALNHANIVQIFDFGRVDDNYFIAMEYVEGVDLANLGDRARARAEPLPIEATVYIVRQLFEGMAYAHTKRDRSGRPAGIIHRDISPHNVLVSFEGQVKISDFGIAKAVEELKRTDRGEIVGKVAYMSPEQARAEVLTTASDIWSGGVILHELLTNQRLFSRESDPDTLKAVANYGIPLASSINEEVPDELDDLLRRILDRNAATRPASAQEVAESLDDVMRAHFSRMNPFRLQQVINDLWDGQPPRPLAWLDGSQTSLPAKRMPSAPVHGGTVPETGGAPKAAREPTRSERPDSTSRAGTAPEVTPRTPSTIGDEVRAPAAAADWSPDPFASPAGSPPSVETPSIAPTHRPGRDTSEDLQPPAAAAADLPAALVEAVQQLKESFRSNPNLWVLVDIGATYEAAGLEARGQAAYELAAAKFAQQGLLVQAAAIYAQLLQKQGPTTRVTAGIHRLCSLPGMSDGELLLEIFDPDEDASDVSEYRELVSSDAPEPVDIIAPAPIFSALGPEQLEHLIQSIRLRTVAPSEEIIREGDTGESFFWIGRGRVVVSTSNFEGRRAYLTSLADGDCFGEQSFFTGRTRDATVEAMDEALLLEIDHTALDELVDQFPAVRDTLRQFYKDRIAESLLARSELFGRLAVRDRRRLAAQFEFKSFGAGDWIIHEGDTSDTFFAVKSGRVRVFTGEDADVELAELGPGDIVGEIAAVTGVMRTANVVAQEPSELLELQAGVLNRFLDANPEIAERMDAEIEKRARDTIDKITDL